MSILCFILHCTSEFYQVIAITCTWLHVHHVHQSIKPVHIHVLVSVLWVASGVCVLIKLDFRRWKRVRCILVNSSSFDTSHRPTSYWKWRMVQRTKERLLPSVNGICCLATNQSITNCGITTAWHTQFAQSRTTSASKWMVWCVSVITHLSVWLGSILLSLLVVYFFIFC